MEEGYEDNFTDLLLMHPAQAYANTKKTRNHREVSIGLIEKCQKAIQLHSIKKKAEKKF